MLLRFSLSASPRAYVAYSAIVKESIHPSLTATPQCLCRKRAARCSSEGKAPRDEPPFSHFSAFGVYK